MDSLIDLIEAGEVPAADTAHDLVDDFGADGMSPLQVAVESANSGAVRALLAMGANPNYGHVHSHRVPLWTAISYDAPWDIVQALLSSPRIHVDAVNSSGETALHSAAGLSNLRAVHALLHAGASVHIADRLGNTPLFYATENVQVASAIMAAGADVNAINDSDHTFAEDLFAQAMDEHRKRTTVVPTLMAAMRHGLRLTSSAIQAIMDRETVQPPIAVTIMSTLDNVDLGWSSLSGRDCVEYAVLSDLTAVADHLVGLLDYDVDRLGPVAALTNDAAMMAMLVDRHGMRIDDDTAADIVTAAVQHENKAVVMYVADRLAADSLSADTHDALVMAIISSQDATLVKTVARALRLNMVAPIDGRSPLDKLVTAVPTNPDFITDFIYHFTPRQGVSALSGAAAPLVMGHERARQAYHHTHTLRNMAVAVLPEVYSDSPVGRRHLNFGLYKTHHD